jgi:hypothetical protein
LFHRQQAATRCNFVPHQRGFEALGSAAQIATKV